MPDVSPSLANAFSDFNQNLNVQTLCDAFNVRCDSERSLMQVTNAYNEIPGAPLSGTGLLMVEGQSSAQASAIFALCKVDGSNGQINTVMQVEGAGAHADESYSVEWQDGSPPTLMTSGNPQSCRIRWRH